MAGFLKSPLPVDTKRGDWGRIVAQGLNDIERAYIFNLWFPDVPVDDEVLWVHPCATWFAIFADWGDRIEGTDAVYENVVPSIDVNATATFAIDVQVKRKGESSYTSFGTWSIATDGVLTATTVDSKGYAFERGDVIRWVAPSTADDTIAEMAFTVIGSRG